MEVKDIIVGKVCVNDVEVGSISAPALCEEGAEVVLTETIFDTVLKVGGDKSQT